jgi:hypothetical protein
VLFPGSPTGTRRQIGGMHTAVIHLHRNAPRKPALGDTCNGCGACCAAEPCPIGAVMSLKRSGACHALEWSDDEQRYHCGLLRRASQTGRPAQRLVARWIAAGQGCDAELEVEPATGEDAVCEA